MGLQEAAPAGRDRRTVVPFVQCPPQGRGVVACGGQIIDSTIIPVPKQHNQREENASIKRGELPQGWQDNPAWLRQKDQDARRTKKNQASHYGYKNSISIDASYGLIRRYEITPANVHDSQLLPALLDGENSDP